MPLEVIYVVRHGFRSAWSVNPSTGVYAASIPSPTGIAADPALTSHGVRQAEELGRHLLTIAPAIDAVYSSPYYRCLQTIKPYVRLKQEQLAAGGDSTMIKIHPERGISEWFGSAPFDHPEPASTAMLKSMFSHYDEEYVSAQIPSKQGETLEGLTQRLTASVRIIIDRAEAEGHRSIVLCTHAAVVIILGRILTGNFPVNPETDDFQAYTCGLSEYRRQQNIEQALPDVTSRIGGWTCELNSDCSFLSTGAERGWKFAGDESFPGTGSMSQEPDAKL